VSKSNAGRPAIFLDRDGTLIEDAGYLSDPSQLRLLPGVADALVALERAGYLRIVITNQSGIGRGLFPKAAFDATQRELERQLGTAGASLDATYHCPHAPDAGCPCRKPGTALHREAAATFGVDLARSWCVGDGIRDLKPAAELGCRAMLVRTGQGAGHADAAIAISALVADDLAAGTGILSRYL
jgi:histidinol-phosphate phosphatase family protein